jgi:hypothetical protein
MITATGEECQRRNLTSPPDPLSKQSIEEGYCETCLERGREFERGLHPLSLRTPAFKMRRKRERDSP